MKGYLFLSIAGEFLKEIHSDVRLDNTNTVVKLSGGEASNEILEKYKEELTMAQTSLYYYQLKLYYSFIFHFKMSD